MGCCFGHDGQENDEVLQNLEAGSVVDVSEREEVDRSAAKSLQTFFRTHSMYIVSGVVALLVVAALVYGGYRHIRVPKVDPKVVPKELETAKKEPEAAPVAVAEAHATRVHELKTTIAAAAKEHKICVQQLQYVFDKLEEASTVDALELKKVFDAAEKDHAARVQARETERGAAAKDADKRIADPTASAEVHNARVQELEAERDAAAKEHKTCVEKMQELFDTLRVASSSDAGELKLQFDRLEKDHATLLDLEKRVSDLVAEITSVKFQKGSSEHKELFNKYIELIHNIESTTNDEKKPLNALLDRVRAAWDA
eukprot:512984_1